MLSGVKSSVKSFLTGESAARGSQQISNIMSQTASSAGTNQTTKLEAKLRSDTIEHRDSTGATHFSHANMITEILDEREVTTLINERDWNKPGTSTRLKYSDFNPGTEDSFLPTLAILLQIECEDSITSFIEEGVSARVLPLYGVREGGEGSYLDFYSRDSQGNRAKRVALSCLRSNIKRTTFDIWQYRVAPRLVINKISDDYFEARHEFFCERTILPWRKLTVDEARVETRSSAIESGYSQVEKVRMDPRSHNFDEVLDKLQLSCDGFAVKTLRKLNEQADPKRYENEIAQLKRFNAFRHEHLVMLLVSFQLADTYNFVFPYAEGNLSDFWERSPSRETGDILWLVQQLRGITEAVSLIHVPPWEPGKFGRHGDIKPENILIFNRPNGERQIMVLSDMGLTAIHSEFSRSRVSPAKITTTPTYRPPESDFNADEISRAFDIWTLGCLFMEAMVWHLGGQPLLAKFTHARLSSDVKGLLTSIYFEIKVMKTQFLTVKTNYTASVKESVIEWFNEIRRHENSTQLVHDIIDLVEDEMLIVRRKTKDRITSALLVDRLNDIYDKCQDSKYIHVKTHDTRSKQDPVHVEVELMPKILDDLASGKVTMRSYTGNKTEPGIDKSKLEEQ